MALVIYTDTWRVKTGHATQTTIANHRRSVGGGEVRAAPGGTCHWRQTGENCKTTYTCKFRLYQFLLAYEERETELALTGRTQHHIRGRNATPLSFTLRLISYKLRLCEIRYLQKKLIARTEATRGSVSLKLLQLFNTVRNYGVE